MVAGDNLRRLKLTGLLAGLAFLVASPALADPYRLASGDVVQLTVVGFPDLKQRTPINVDGEVMLPLVGAVKAAGQTVTELSNAVKARFANKVMQQRGLDGRAVSIVVAPDEVTIDIAEYRPIYLRGDVSKPGEQPFRPGMTIRQAVAVAGGYDVVRFRTGNPVIESTQLRGEAQSLWSEVLRYDAIIWRLRAEMGQDSAPDKSAYAKSPLNPDMVDLTFKTEADQLATRRAERDREMNYYKAVITQSDKRIVLLSEQEKNEEEGSKQDADDFDRVTKLFEKGNTSITRFSDSRRAMLLSATRILQTSAAVAQVEREREELKKQLADVDDKRRIVALSEMQETQGKLQQAKAKLNSTQEQLLYSTKMRAQLGSSTDKQVELVIVRQSNKGRERLVAQEDTELWPGDAIEVAMDTSQLLSFPN
ncbi:MAG: exopolysaccharide production protein [Hyphomicrobiales bacterium]|nr:exopolysaccharide production protein [Hyphomicrobiales bacterium]